MQCKNEMKFARILHSRRPLRVEILYRRQKGRAAAFLAAAENCYFRRVCTFSLYPACRVNETLQNATLDAAIGVDTAENQIFKA